jgi:hypothetical protein
MNFGLISRLVDSKSGRACHSYQNAAHSAPPKRTAHSMQLARQIVYLAWSVHMIENRHLLFNRVALVIYGPVSCLLIGMIAAYVGRITSHGIVVFQGGFLQYALPFPGNAGTIQLPGLLLGFLGSGDIILIFPVRTILFHPPKPRISFVSPDLPGKGLVDRNRAPIS